MQLRFSLNTILLFLVIGGLTVGGCTIHKRHFRNGYYVQIGIGNELQSDHYRQASFAEIQDTSVLKVSFDSTEVSESLMSDTIEQSEIHTSRTERELNFDTRSEKHSILTGTPQSHLAKLKDENEDLGPHPVWEFLIVTLVAMILIAALAMLTEMYIIAFVALGLAVLAYLFGVTLITARFVKKDEGDSEEIRKRKKRAFWLAIASLVLLVAFIILAPATEIAAVALAVAAVVTILLAMMNSKKAGRIRTNKAERSEPKEKIDKYILAQIGGPIALIFALIGVRLAITAIPIGYALILTGLSLVLAIYAVIRIRQRKKNSVVLKDQNKENDIQTRLLVSLFTSISSLIINLAYGLFVVWMIGGMGGF